MTIEQDTIPGVVLAAGKSGRFGPQNKLLAKLNGLPLVFHALRALINSKADPVYLVVGFEKDIVLDALGGLKDNDKLKIVENDDWESGRSSSVKAAIDSFSKKDKAAVFLPGDMPLMTNALINRVIDNYLESEKLCFPIKNGKKGHPVVWPKEFWSDISDLEGDETGMELAKKNWDAAEKLELTSREERTQSDIDTLKDLEKISG
jgi:molybdenum cofactor cytidylyltransferase